MTHFPCPREVYNLVMFWKAIQGTYLANVTFSVIWENCMFQFAKGDRAGHSSGLQAVCLRQCKKEWSSHRDLPGPASSPDWINEPGESPDTAGEGNNSKHSQSEAE